MHRFPRLASKAILAPMAGVTDSAFRHLCRDLGAGLTYTEFVNSAGLVRNKEDSDAGQRARRLLQKADNEKPAAAQLFSDTQEELLWGAKLIEKDFDIIDINCGCPAWKVIKCGAGSALLKDTAKLKAIVQELSDALTCPVTVKIRTGFGKTINAVEVAQACEAAGAAAITVHGRTQQQGYRGKADWAIIKQVKESVSIPVIGNGDVSTPEEFAKRLDESGVDYVMIGRAAMNNPFLFHEIREYLSHGTYSALTSEEKLKEFGAYLDLAGRYGVPFQRIKYHANHFTKGVSHSAQLRDRIGKARTLQELKDTLSL